MENTLFSLFSKFSFSFTRARSPSLYRLKRQYIMHFDRGFVMDLSRCMSINARIKYRLVMRSVLSISHYRSLRAFNHILIELLSPAIGRVRVHGKRMANMRNIWTHKLRTKSMHWISQFFRLPVLRLSPPLAIARIHSSRFMKRIDLKFIRKQRRQRRLIFRRLHRIMCRNALCNP